MPYDLEISEHQAAIADLRQRQQQEHTESLKSQLRDVRQRLLPARTEHTVLTATLPTLDAARYDAQQKVLRWGEEISIHLRRRPAAADYLDPSEDQEVAKWQFDHNRLVALRDEAIRKIPPPPPHLRQSELAAEIQQLEFAEQNILRALDGSVGKFPNGGVFGVS